MHAAGASGDAIELYEKAIQQDPAADELYNQVIILFQQLERNEEVIAFFEKHCDVLGVTPAQSPLDNARLIYETVLKQTPSTNN